MFKNIMIVLAAVAVGLTGVVALNFVQYGVFSFFAPKYEAVRRDVMIESRYYSEATVRELYRLMRQYNGASTEDAKRTIRAAALHEFSIFPKDRLPSDLQVWFAQLDQ